MKDGMIHVLMEKLKSNSARDVLPTAMRSSQNQKDGMIHAQVI
jgi:hypothetical protein